MFDFEGFLKRRTYLSIPLDQYGAAEYNNSQLYNYFYEKSKVAEKEFYRLDSICGDIEMFGLYDIEPPVDYAVEWVEAQ